MKQQSLIFRILEKITNFLYNIRQDEGALGQINDWLDKISSKFYSEEIYWHNYRLEKQDKEKQEYTPPVKQVGKVKAVYCRETDDWLFI